jgi:hypothetical protein
MSAQGHVQTQTQAQAQAQAQAQTLIQTQIQTTGTVLAERKKRKGKPLTVAKLKEKEGPDLWGKRAIMTFYGGKGDNPTKNNLGAAGLYAGSFSWSYKGEQVNVHTIAVPQRDWPKMYYKILMIHTRKGVVFGHVNSFCNKDEDKDSCYEKNVQISTTNTKVDKQDEFLIDLHATGFADAGMSNGVEFVLYKVVGFRGLADINKNRYSPNILCKYETNDWRKRGNASGCKHR